MRANSTKASLETIRDMVRAYGPEFNEAAMETTKLKLIKENTRAFESLGAKLGTLRNMSRYDLSKTYVEDQQAELVGMTVDDFQRIAAEYLKEDEMIYVIVGDKETQMGPVSEFAKESGKGDVVELDIYGALL